MINPIVIIISAAILLSVIAVCIINRPKKPFITGTLILLLIAFVIFTFMIDSEINSLGKSDPNSFIGFITMNDVMTYDSLGDSFHTFMIIDMGLIAASLLSLFTEIMIILRKNSKK